MILLSFLLAGPAHAAFTTQHDENFQSDTYPLDTPVTSGTGVFDTVTGNAVSTVLRPNGRDREVRLDGESITGVAIGSITQSYTQTPLQSGAGRYTIGVKLRPDLSSQRITNSNASSPGFEVAMENDDGAGGGAFSVQLVTDPGGRRSVYFHSTASPTRRVETFELGEIIRISMQVTAGVNDRLRLAIDGVAVWRGDVNFGGGTTNNPELALAINEFSTRAANDPFTRVGLLNLQSSYNPEPGAAGLLLAGLALPRRRRPH